MRTIDEIYLTSGTQSLTSNPAQPESFEGAEGDPRAQKTTPTNTRVPLNELELTYLHNPTIFNGVNKITQTIMSASHEITAEDPNVKKYFDEFTSNLGNSGSDITWEELLSQIYKFQCIYGRSWIENIWNKKGTTIVDWDLIDPKKMDYSKDSQQKLALDKFGKPLGYVETLPYDVPAKTQILPEYARKIVTLPSNSIFLEPKRIALIKLFTVGDGFYPIGLIEPIYKTSLRKLNIEEALANAIWRHGFPIMLATIGDSNHEPTPQQVTSILSKLKDVNFKQELSIPYYYDLKILEAKKAEKLREHLEYFKDQEIAGLGIPKPFATGGGEATNRATLASQSDMFQLTLRDIINKTVFSIQKYMFKPICDIEGFKEIPNIKWDLVGPDELNEQSKRMIEYVKANIFTAEEVKPLIKQSEQMI